MNEMVYGEIALGQKASFSRAITRKEVDQFTQLSQDCNPLHIDAEYASKTEWKRPVVYGFLQSSLLSKLIGEYLPGKFALLLAAELQWKHPCFVGDMLNIKGEVIQKVDAAKVIKIKASIENQHGQVLTTALLTAKVLK